MLNNDISNRQAPSLLFRLDDFVVVPRKLTTKDRIKNLFKGDVDTYEIDTKVTRTIYDIFRHTDFTVGLVVLESEWKRYSVALKGKILDLPVSDIYVVHTPFDIYTKLQNGEYLFYIDDNKDNHTLVGHNACLTLQELNERLK